MQCIGISQPIELYSLTKAENLSLPAMSAVSVNAAGCIAAPESRSAFLRLCLESPHGLLSDPAAQSAFFSQLMPLAELCRCQALCLDVRNVRSFDSAACGELLSACSDTAHRGGMYFFVLLQSRPLYLPLCAIPEGADRIILDLTHIEALPLIQSRLLDAVTELSREKLVPLFSGRAKRGSESFPPSAAEQLARTSGARIYRDEDTALAGFRHKNTPYSFYDFLSVKARYNAALRLSLPGIAFDLLPDAAHFLPTVKL